MDPDSSIIKLRGIFRFWFPWALLCSVGDPWHFGADPDPAPAPDPTPFLSDFKDAKKNFFLHIFFLFSLPARTLSSVLKIKFFAKFCVKILFCKHYYSLLNTFMRNRIQRKNLTRMRIHKSDRLVGSKTKWDRYPRKRRGLLDTGTWAAHLERMVANILGQHAQDSHQANPVLIS